MGGLGHTALPKQFSPEPPSGGLNRTDEEGKERTEGGLGGPVLTPPVGLLPTPAPEPRSLLWSLFVAPAHLLWARRASAGPPARRPRVLPRAPFMQFPAVPSPPPRARGDGEPLRRRENPAAATESQ